MLDERPNHRDGSARADDGPPADADRPDADGGAAAAPRRTGRVVLRPIGLKTLLPFLARPVVVDFDAGVIAQGRTVLPFHELRLVQLRMGILGASDARRWICLDATRVSDGAGVLCRPDGSLSESFAQLLYDLRSVVPDGYESVPPVFDLGYRVRIDVSSIVLSLLLLGLFVGFYARGERGFGDIFDSAVLNQVLLVLGGSVVWLYLWRALGGVRIDTEGVERRRAWYRRRVPWSELRIARQQGLELELDGERRLALNLDLLKSGGASVLMRRGMRPVLSPLGACLLEFVRVRTVEQPARPIYASRRERLQSRLWAGAIVAACGTMFVISQPPRLFGGSEAAFGERLIDLGARTLYSFEEPWRFFTALFLHADVLHIALNMLVIVTLAPFLQHIFGLPRATTLYLAGGVLGNALAQVGIFFGGGAAPTMSLGASTALMAVVGSLLAAIYRRPASVPLAVRERFRWAIPVFVLLTMALGVSVRFVDNEAHLCGFLVGFALAFLIPPKKVPAAIERTAA